MDTPNSTGARCLVSACDAYRNLYQASKIDSMRAINRIVGYSGELHICDHTDEICELCCYAWASKIYRYMAEACDLSYDHHRDN